MLDFANLLKAFIGTNYFSLAFGFQQSGLIVSSLHNVIHVMNTHHEKLCQYLCEFRSVEVDCAMSKNVIHVQLCPLKSCIWLTKCIGTEGGAANFCLQK